MPGLLSVIRDSTNAERPGAFFEYLFQASKEKGIPFSGTFELTPRCTLNCPMCYVHLREEQMHRKELATRQWIDLIGQASKAGMMHARLTGGECFLHPGFQDIFQALQDLGAFVKILTNATLLDEKMVSWLARRPIEVIQVSVYGCSPEMYQATTGSASAFYLVDRALDLLREAGIRFELSITVSRALVPFVERIYAYCQAKGPRSLKLSANPFPARPETGKKAEDYRLDLEASVAYYRKYYELTGKTIPYCGAEDEGDPSSALPAEGVLCAAGKASFCIAWDGKLVPCNAMSFISANPLQVGFQSAWESIRDAAACYRYPAQCVRCSVRHRCLACPGAHPDARFNQAQCEETKTLIQEGLL